MKLAFKFWGLNPTGYNKELKRIYPFVYPPYWDITGIAFTNIRSVHKCPIWMKRYKLTKLG